MNPTPNTKASNTTAPEPKSPTARPTRSCETSNPLANTTLYFTRSLRWAITPPGHWTVISKERKPPPLPSL